MKLLALIKAHQGHKDSIEQSEVISVEQHTGYMQTIQIS